MTTFTENITSILVTLIIPLVFVWFDCLYQFRSRNRFKSTQQLSHQLQLTKPHSKQNRDETLHLHELTYVVCEAM